MPCGVIVGGWKRSCLKNLLPSCFDCTCSARGLSRYYGLFSDFYPCVYISFLVYQSTCMLLHDGKKGKNLCIIAYWTYMMSGNEILDILCAYLENQRVRYWSRQLPGSYLYILTLILAYFLLLLAILGGS